MTTYDWDAAPFLEKVLGIVPSVIYVFNQESQSNEYSNRSLGSVLGFTPSEVKEMGQALLPRLAHPDDLLQIIEHFATIRELQDGAVATVEYRMRHKGGRWVWLLSYDSVFERAEDGSVIRHIGIATDISAQKEAEAHAIVSQKKAEQTSIEAREISDLLTQIMDTTRSSIIALNSDGSVVSINSTGREFFRVSGEEIPFPRPTVEFTDKETLQPIAREKDPFVRALAGQNLNGDIFLMRRGENDGVYVRVSSAVVDAENSDVRSVLVFDDVSEQEHSRQQIERTSRLDALGQLTGGIAHDFNNLLATVQYSLDLAKSADPASRHVYIETAQKSVERGSALTNRLLAFAKQQPGLSQSTEVATFLVDFSNLCTPLIEASIEIKYVIQEDDLWVFCDPAQLENALLNLVLNARDALLSTGKGNQITILVRTINELDADTTLRQEQSNTYIARALFAEQLMDEQRIGNSAFRYIEFAVTDNGSGMSEEVKRRAIDPFFTTKNAASGTGLGLSMVYGFIEQSGGELRIYSEAEQGTTVRMLLPRGTAYGDREKPLIRTEPKRGQGERILVVEDEVRLAIVIRDLIRSLGYVVDTATNGAEALTILDQKSDVSLVITDIAMPGGLNGFQLAEAIRERYTDMPLIYMSGYAVYSDEDMGRVIAPILQKPCPQDELARAIREALEA